MENGQWLQEWWDAAVTWLKELWSGIWGKLLTVAGVWYLIRLGITFVSNWLRGQRVKAVEEEQGKQKAKIVELNKTVTKLDNTVTRLENTVTRLENIADKHASSIARLENITVTNTEGIASLEKMGIEHADNMIELIDLIKRMSGGK